MKRLTHVDMKKYTSFRAGGYADEMLIPDTIEELQEALKEVSERGRKLLILGNGSNTLFKDTGFSGTVIKLGEGLGKIEAEGEYLICGCQALMSSVAKAALASSLTGFEFASGIPGSLGGAVFMNAGAYGGEMKNIVEEVTLVSRDGRDVKTVKGEDLDLSYRHSILEETGEIAVSVKLKLEKGDADIISKTMSELTKKRNEKQPVQYPSAGSFFKRPEGYYAGKLVQDAGMKGVSVGGAQVSELHSGFVINRGNATATDIIELMHLVQNIVYDKFQVRLEPEVRIVGD